jgi:hypothetical protein
MKAFYLLLLHPIDAKNCEFEDTGYYVGCIPTHQDSFKYFTEYLKIILLQMRFLYYEASLHSFYSNKKLLPQLSAFIHCFWCQGRQTHVKLLIL